ncbi:hypothetical protein AAC387_Pa05g3195 [Persea americana]
MGGDHSSSKSSRRKKLSDTSDSSPSSEGESQEKRRSRRHHRHEDRPRGTRGSRRNESEAAEKSKRRKSRRDKKERRKTEQHRRKSSRENRKDVSDSDGSSSSSDDLELKVVEPEKVVHYILKKFPGVTDDLRQLLQMIDDGQAVDTRGISNRDLVKLLKKLFLSLCLKQNDSGVFFLPPTARPTMEAVGSLINLHQKPVEHQLPPIGSASGVQSLPPEIESQKTIEEAYDEESARRDTKDDSSASCKRRFIGPEMPSAELLAAAAKLTDAETMLREAELEVDNDVFIGPAPPAMVAEAESANEAERFEEVMRIVGVEGGDPYDVVGVNHKMSIENIKKRYWKLSLMVHPDKCSHPQAHQAFVQLNKAFKELQDPDKRKVLDEKIKLKEEQEEFLAELKAHREAAQWRQLQGISMPGDDELLAETKLPQKRDEWMTTLPPERKPGVSMHSTTTFSRNSREGRGDTSVWTDNPLDKAQKAKMNYLEAYNEAAAIVAGEDKKKHSSDAELVDMYNRSKRSVSLVQKHREEASSRPKKKNKQQQEKGEWEGQHPWKPWDREKDLVAGRQKVNFDSENMTQGLSSRFSSGTIQRNFL